MKYNPLDTRSFQYLVQTNGSDLAALTPRNVGISVAFERDRVGDLYFKDPGPKWEQIEADEILQVGRADWMIARLLYLLREVDNSINLDEVSRTNEETWSILLEVWENQSPVADLVLYITKGRVGWSGQADTFYHSSAPVEELEATLTQHPRAVAECEIVVPSRKSTIGWTGKRFRSQKKVKRPDYYSREAMARRAAGREAVHNRALQASCNRGFTITEHPLSENALERNSATQGMRFTDIYPPVELWETTPNWSYAIDEEGRRGQDETTLKPAKNQTVITEDVDYTAGEVWLPDETCHAALIQVSRGEPSGVVCFGDHAIWIFPVVGPLDDRAVESRATEEQLRRFPLRVVSRLSRNRKHPTDNIRVLVDQTGKWSQLPDAWV